MRQLLSNSLWASFAALCLHTRSEPRATFAHYLHSPGCCFLKLVFFPRQPSCIISPLPSSSFFPSLFLLFRPFCVSFISSHAVPSPPSATAQPPAAAASFRIGCIFGISIPLWEQQWGCMNTSSQASLFAWLPSLMNSRRVWPANLEIIEKLLRGGGKVERTTCIPHQGSANTQQALPCIRPRSTQSQHLSLIMNESAPPPMFSVFIPVTHAVFPEPPYVRRAERI